MQAIGLDGLGYLEDEDLFRNQVRILLTKRVIDLKREWDEEFASRIANKIGKAMNG